MRSMNPFEEQKSLNMMNDTVTSQNDDSLIRTNSKSKDSAVKTGSSGKSRLRPMSMDEMSSPLLVAAESNYDQSREPKLIIEVDEEDNDSKLDAPLSIDLAEKERLKRTG